MKPKFKYGLGEIVSHKLKKERVFIIARYQREHICGAKDIQYLVREVKEMKVFEVEENELK